MYNKVWGDLKASLKNSTYIQKLIHEKTIIYKNVVLYTQNLVSFQHTKSQKKILDKCEFIVEKWNRSTNLGKYTIKYLIFSYSSEINGSCLVNFSYIPKNKWQILKQLAIQFYQEYIPIISE